MYSQDISKKLKLLEVPKNEAEGVVRFLNESVQIDKYSVHKRLNLYIDMGARCTAMCPFCITQTKCTSQRKKNLAKQLENLQKIVKYCYSVEILGGEPTLYANDVKLMLPYLKDKVKIIVTNGTSGKFLENLDLLAQFDHIDISRHGLSEKDNQLAFNTPNKLLTKKDINNLPDNIKKKIRLNITCHKKALSNTNDMLKFIREFQKIGINEFMFANLTKLAKNVYTDQLEKFTDENRLQEEVFMELFEELKQQGFLVVKDFVGLGYKIKIVRKDKALIVLKDNNDEKNPKLYDDLFKKLNYLADLILYPSGDVYTDWYLTNKIA